MSETDELRKDSGLDADDNRVTEERREGARLKLMQQVPEPLVDSIFLDNDVALQPCNNARQVTQILSVAAVSFGAYLCGTVIAYPAVATPSLDASNRTDWTRTDFLSTMDDNDGVPVDRLPFVLYQDDLNFLTSILMVGTLVSTFLAGPISNWIGRKWTFIVGVCGTVSSGYILIATAHWAWMMLLGRFLHGAAIGFSTTIANVYIMEIATPNLRGRLAVVPAIAGTIGIITAQITGEFLSWKLLAVILASLNILFIFFLTFIPESPVYLITTNRIDGAHKALRMLRGRSWNITKELTDIKVAQEDVKDNVKLRDFATRSVCKPFLISLGLMLFMQLTGINIVIMFTPNIFEIADSSIPKFLATQIVGLALLLSNAVTILLADRMPRRTMLLLSALGISVMLNGIGACLQMKANCHGNSTINPQENDSCASSFYSENLRWLPLLLTMFYIFFFNLGYGAMIWMTVVEILPQHVRTLALSLAGGFACLWGFLTTHTYDYLKETITGQGVFFLYGITSFVGLCFIFVYVPETKGRTAGEIQNHFLHSGSSKSP